jgi:hypothetical protein
MIARRELRERDGSAVLVKMNATKIRRLLENGSVVLLDAVFHPDELGELKQCAGKFPIFLVGITSSYELRCVRLAKRRSRPFDERQVHERDQLELAELRTGEVLADATHRIPNDGSVRQFRQHLAAFFEAHIGTQLH